MFKFLSKYHVIFDKTVTFSEFDININLSFSQRKSLTTLCYFRETQLNFTETLKQKTLSRLFETVVTLTTLGIYSLNQLQML